MTVPHNIVAPQPMHHYRVPPTANLLDDLGIDVETYRQLQSIQARDISPNDYDLLLRLGQKSTTKTLDDVSVAKISSDAFVSTEHREEQCAICLCAMSKGEKLIQLHCDGKHVFHSTCIVEWLSISSRCCPVDQQDLSTCCLSA